MPYLQPRLQARGPCIRIDSLPMEMVVKLNDSCRGNTVLKGERNRNKSFVQSGSMDARSSATQLVYQSASNYMSLDDGVQHHSKIGNSKIKRTIPYWHPTTVQPYYPCIALPCQPTTHFKSSQSCEQIHRLPW